LKVDLNFSGTLVLDKKILKRFLRILVKIYGIRIMPFNFMLMIVKNEDT
jgi:hypothetical protein